MKSKNIFSVLIVLGITILAFWGANRLHTFLTTPDAIGEVEVDKDETVKRDTEIYTCLLYTSPSPRDRTRSRMPSSA